MHEKALEILKKSPLNVTPQRVAILDILLSHSGHPNPEWVHKLATEQFPNMALATVYNTLERFEETGLVNKVNPLHGTARYDAITDFHPHAVCMSCGRIDDIPVDRLQLPHLLDVQPHEFSIQSAAVHLMGYCGPCMERERLKKNGAQKTDAPETE